MKELIKLAKRAIEELKRSIDQGAPPKAYVVRQLEDDLKKIEDATDSYEWGR